MAKRAVTMLAAMALAIAPGVANAAASSLSLKNSPAVRAATQTAKPNKAIGGVFPVVLGLALVTILVAVVVEDNDTSPPSSPSSP